MFFSIWQCNRGVCGFTQIFVQAHGSEYSDSKLPQVACNVDPAKKSIDPKGGLFDFKRKTHC